MLRFRQSTSASESKCILQEDASKGADAQRRVAVCAVLLAARQPGKMRAHQKLALSPQEALVLFAAAAVAATALLQLCRPAQAAVTVAAAAYSASCRAHSGASAVGAVVHISVARVPRIEHRASVSLIRPIGADT